MKQILLIALLMLCCLARANQVAAQVQLEVPDVEYANDLSELRTLRRVFVHSTLDTLSRQRILKELRREAGLLDVVERPEDADYFLVFYGTTGQAVDYLAANDGQVGNTGTLIAWRQVKTCDGFRPRVLFITSKSKTVHNGIVLPLTPLNQGGLSLLNQGEFGSRPLSKKAIETEVVVRAGMWIIGKLFPRTVRFDQVNNTLAVGFSDEPEVQAVREFLRQVKKARKERPLVYAEPVRATAGFAPFEASVAQPPPALTESAGATAPCQPKSSQPASANQSEVDVSGSSPGLAVPATLAPDLRLNRAGSKGPNVPTQ